MTPEREAILKSYSEWTAFSSLRSMAPIKSREAIYPLIWGIGFADVLDTSKGKINKDEFEKWHKQTLESLVSATPKLKAQFGWSAKIVNVYLKTYCYVGEGGREGIRALLHPPVDQGLWSGVARRFKGDESVLKDSHVVEEIKNISTHELYLKVIKGMRAASAKLACSLIEVEQLWEGAGKHIRFPQARRPRRTAAKVQMFSGSFSDRTTSA